MGSQSSKIKPTNHKQSNDIVNNIIERKSNGNSTSFMEACALNTIVIGDGVEYFPREKMDFVQDEILEWFCVHESGVSKGTIDESLYFGNLELTSITIVPDLSSSDVGVKPTERPRFLRIVCSVHCGEYEDDYEEIDYEKRTITVVFDLDNCTIQWENMSLSDLRTAAEVEIDSSSESE